MPAIQIKGKVTVTSFKPNPKVLGAALAADPDAKALLLGVADQTVAEARKNLIGLGPQAGRKVPRGTKVHGRYWSSKPVSVARLVNVKDETEVFGYSAKQARTVTRVALVVANHPYSHPYEFGGLGITSSAFMRGARRTVIARHSFVKGRAYR